MIFKMTIFKIIQKDAMDAYGLSNNIADRNFVKPSWRFLEK